jgi:hypothetical protein
MGCRDKLQDRKMAVELRIGRLDQETLDSSLDANLLREGKKTSVEFLGETQELETEELDAGAGDREHLFGSAKVEAGLGLPVHDQDDLATYGLLSFVLDYGGSKKYYFQLSRSGDCFIKTEGHIHIECEKGFYLKTGDPGAKVETSLGASLELKDLVKATVGDALLELLKSGSVTLRGKDGTIEASGVLTLAGAGGVVIGGVGGGLTPVVTLNGSQIKLGSGASLELAVLLGNWQEVLDGHTHLTAGPVPNNTGPVNVPLSSALTGSQTTGSKVLI